jgi:hypothetical protein
MSLETNKAIVAFCQRRLVAMAAQTRNSASIPTPHEPEDKSIADQFLQHRSEASSQTLSLMFSSFPGNNSKIK